MPVPSYIVKQFKEGLVTRVEKESVPKGAASDQLNWLSLGDRIELRRGQSLLGVAENGVGRVSGLIVGRKMGASSTQIPIKSAGRKIKYYDEATEDWIESSLPSIIPATGNDEDMAFSDYQSLAGSIVYASSPSSSIYKIMVANPGDVLDQGMNNHRGWIRVKQNRTFLWNRKDTTGGSDKTGIYGSYIDKDELSDYTNVVGESAGTGTGAQTTFTGTLSMQKTTQAFTDAGAVMTAVGHGMSNGNVVKVSSSGTLPVGLTAGQLYFIVNVSANDFGLSLTSGGVAITTTSGSGVHTITKTGIRRTCMYAVFTDTVETFQDNRDGTLTGSAGGSGTLNYATGAFSITFAAAPANLQAITCTYYWEDATSAGVLDFTKSTPRTAGQGFVFRQDDGGSDMENLGSINGVEYCLHKYKTWALTLSSDDTAATNLIYRSKVGIPAKRAMVETGDGIYYVDESDESDPYLRLLRTNSLGSNVIPNSMSDKVSLAGYRFDRCSMREWGNYIVFSGRTSDQTVNNRTFFYHKFWKSIDVTDIRASTLEEYESGLIAGDDGSNNVYRIFDGWTDEESNIENYWISGKTLLDVEGVKAYTTLVIAGLISQDQELKVSISYENGEFVELFTITGDGEYVDTGTQIMIGSSMIGSSEIGGAGSDGIEASPYRAEVDVNTSKFEYMRLKIEATKVGYVSMSEYQCKDIRYKGNKLPNQYLVRT